MSKIDKFVSQERIPNNKFVTEVIQQLADERDFDIEVLDEGNPISIHILSIPEPGSEKRELPTYAVLEIFVSTAVDRMRVLYPMYNWTLGLNIAIETLGVFSISINEDSLGV
jgi:hypothetical protein